METKLYYACLKGDVEALEALMRDDELTLARISISSCSNHTPLHLASMLGHFQFAKSILRHKPDFASRLDSQGRSPLHLASANGYAEIVGALLEHDQSMCRVCDEDGRTPLHLAVMNGQHKCVTELLKVKSELCDPDGIVLHMCVLYNRLNVLILVLDSNDQDLSSIKDDNGDTVLHTATSLRRLQMIKYLLTRSEADVDAVNKSGLTALDIAEKMPKDIKTMEIKELLIAASKKAATTNEPLGSSINAGISGGVADDNIGKAEANTKLKIMWKPVKNFIFQEKKDNRDESLLIAASVIAAMAYQAAISPPGGIAAIDALQELPSNPGSNFLKPGHSLLAFFDPGLSNTFWISNTVSFLASLSVIFIFVSGAAPKLRILIWLIRAAIWVTLSSMTLAYACAVRATTPGKEYDKMNKNTFVAIETGLLIWMGLLSFSLFVLIFRSVRHLVRKLRASRRKNTKEAAALRAPNANNIV